MDEYVIAVDRMFTVEAENQGEALQQVSDQLGLPVENLKVEEKFD